MTLEELRQRYEWLQKLASGRMGDATCVCLVFKHDLPEKEVRLRQELGMGDQDLLEAGYTEAYVRFGSVEEADAERAKNKAELGL